MNNPWDIRTNDNRLSDSITTFIIFCEDEVSEPSYLNLFNSPKIKLNFILNQKNMMDNVFNAIHHCKENKLFDFEGDKEIISKNGLQVWCVFDRDKEESDKKISLGNIDLDESIITARSKNINVAWSNDSFELWILMHFQDIDPNDSTLINRIKYYEKLTDIFSNLTDPSQYLVKMLSYEGFSYQRNLKTKKSFMSIVRKELTKNIDAAITRAKMLEDYFVNVRDHKKSPYTNVHKLVIELIKNG